MIYTDTNTHVIVREIGHTLVARVTKYNTTTTYNILRSKDRHKTSDFRRIFQQIPSFCVITKARKVRVIMSVLKKLLVQ